MSTSVQWTGIEEFRQWLQSLPSDAAGEADHIAQGEANAAAVQIRSRYLPNASNLATKTLVYRTSTRGIVKYTVRNSHPLARIYELGTVARHYFTRHGVEHLTGRMPAKHAFLPVYYQRRRVMFLLLKDMLVRFGFTKVFGDA